LLGTEAHAALILDLVDQKSDVTLKGDPGGVG
jgi:hypothetical protein